MRVLAMPLLVIVLSCGIGAGLLAASPAPPTHLKTCSQLIAALKNPKYATEAKGVGDFYCIDGPIAEVRITPASRLKGSILESGDRVRIGGCAHPGPHPVVTVLSLQRVLSGGAPTRADEISCASKTRTIHIGIPSPPNPLFAGLKRFILVVATLFRERNLSMTADVSRGHFGDALRSSMLSSPQFVPESLDRISFGWAGGEPPFRVEFVNPSQNATFEINTMHRSLIDVPLSRSAKRVDLQIVDKNGSMVRCTIERSEAPPPSARALSVERQAAAMLNDPRRRWRLYAYSLIAPKRGESLIAELLAGRLSGEY